MARIIKRIGAISLWVVGLILVLVGVNSNDPYLVPLRGMPNVVIVLMGASVALFLLTRSYRRGWRIAEALLVLAWCAVPLSMLSARATFEWRRNAVLLTEPVRAQGLGRHFIVGYSSFSEVASLAERGLIAGIYVTRHNIRGR